MKISVIMASWVNIMREHAELKLIRAIDSFLEQLHNDKELIIISDACDITRKVYQEKYSNRPEIIYYEMEKKQPMFSGSLRTKGLELATGDIICYLDSDDFFGTGHLQAIEQGFRNWVGYADVVYYNDYLVMDKKLEQVSIRWVDMRWSHIGTSSIAHRNIKGLKWFNGYGHDFIFVQSLNAMGLNFKKISAAYIVAHSGYGDF